MGSQGSRAGREAVMLQVNWRKQIIKKITMRWCNVTYQPTFQCHKMYLSGD